jgi:hypothetical protein
VIYVKTIFTTPLNPPAFHAANTVKIHSRSYDSGQFHWVFGLRPPISHRKNGSSTVAPLRWTWHTVYTLTVYTLTVYTLDQIILTVYIHTRTHSVYALDQITLTVYIHTRAYGVYTLDQIILSLYIQIRHTIYSEILDSWITTQDLTWQIRGWEHTRCILYFGPRPRC